MASAGESGKEDLESKLKQLKYSRRGKKGAITKRIRQITALVDESAGRRRIQLLLEALLTVYQELIGVCNLISTMNGGEDDPFNDLEEIRIDVDDCSALVAEYLERRRDDPPSSDSMTASWVARHQPGNFEESTVGSTRRSGSSSGASKKSEESQL